MHTVVVEIRAAEGGMDAKLLVNEMATLYKKACAVNNFPILSFHWKDGFATFTIQGQSAKDFFLQESGGHRWQRIPPTETKGRVHTSTVTVAVLDSENKAQAYKLDRNQVYRQYTRDSGPGGQHRNKVESAVVLVHKPTGITVKSANDRSRHKNEEIAWKELEQRLANMHNESKHREINNSRSSQIGSGERGDKRRTYRVQDGTVKDDITGKRATIRDIYKGYIGYLHK